MPFSKGFTPWNKGLNKDDPRVLRHALHISQTMKGCKGKPHTEKTKKRLSEVAKEQGLGGYVKGSGRGKKGWYKGFFCDSSWELAYIIYCLDKGIQIQRNLERRTYIWNNKKEIYIPDFIVNGEIIEIKGYRTSQWQAKQLANPDVKVLYEKDLKDVFKYIKTTYGKDFIKLYERLK